jgi:hypothetical protein
MPYRSRKDEVMTSFLWPLFAGGDLIGFLVYLVTVATVCAWEQYQYYTEVMLTPIQNNNEES